MEAWDYEEREREDMKRAHQRRRKQQAYREQKRKQRRRRVFLARSVFLLLLVLFVWFFVLVARMIGQMIDGEPVKVESTLLERLFYHGERLVIEERPELIVDLLTYNEYSRVGHALPEVNNIFVHYTANPGTSAAQNRSYFENLKDTHETSASAHFIIGMEGEIVQCIPLAEVAYAVKGRNYDSVSIECCYDSEDGSFREATYQSLIHLTAWLISKYDLKVEDILRHYDEGGKMCPIYYVQNEEAWQTFLLDVETYIEKNGVKRNLWE